MMHSCCMSSARNELSSSIIIRCSCLCVFIKNAIPFFHRYFSIPAFAFDSLNYDAMLVRAKRLDLVSTPSVGDHYDLTCFNAFLDSICDILSHDDDVTDFLFVMMTVFGERLLFGIGVCSTI